MKSCVGVIITAGAIAALSGCATETYSVPGVDTAAVPSSTLRIVDARPAEQRTADYTQLSHWVTSCSYGIYRIGDAITSPGKLDLMRSDLEKSLGNQIDGKTLTISNYVMYLNAKQAMLGANPFSKIETGGLAGALISQTAEPNCTKADTPEGWYDPSEANAKASPVIALISANLDGRNYSVRVVFSPDNALSPRGGESGPVFASVLHRANLALADKIQGRTEFAATPGSLTPIAVQQALSPGKAPDSVPAIPACSPDQLKFAKWARDNGYQYVQACQE